MCEVVTFQMEAVHGAHHVTFGLTPPLVMRLPFRFRSSRDDVAAMTRVSEIRRSSFDIDALTADITTASTCSAPNRLGILIKQ